LSSKCIWHLERIPVMFGCSLLASRPCRYAFSQSTGPQ
jgi:hypothetical protein